MPARLVDLSLLSVEFPFLTMDMQRTAILQDVPDQAYTSPSIVRPQSMFLYNVLPCKEGYDSIQINQVFYPPTTGGTFQSAYSFYDQSGIGHLFGISDTRIYLADEGITQWYLGVGSLVSNTEYTRFHLNGETFIYASTFGIYHLEAGTLTLDTLTGISAGSILGFTSSAGYAIAYDATKIYYTTNVTKSGSVWTFNFTPVLGSAGSFNIQDLKGIIVAALPIQNGFIVYSYENAVACMYAANPDQPFNSSEIKGSDGVRSQFQVAYDQNLGFHYAWTRHGLQKVTPTEAINEFPEVFDFMGKKTKETFDPATGTFTRTVQAGALAVRMRILGNRFLSISYGIASETFPQSYYSAVIYDVDLGRWGKINDDHVDIFDYNFLADVNYLTYNDEAAVAYNALAATSYAQMVSGLNGKQLGYYISLLKSNGEIWTYRRSNMADTNPSTSQILFGRVQYYKFGAQEIQELECESFSGTCSIYTNTTENPQQTLTVAAGSDITNQASSAGFARRFGFRSAGRYQNILFQGKFHLTTVSCKISKNGSR